MSLVSQARAWLVRGVVLIGSALLTLAVVEGVFRVYESWRFEAFGDLWAVYDETLGYRNNPAFGDHNAAGFRDRPGASKAGRFRNRVLAPDLDHSVSGHGLDRPVDHQPGGGQRVKTPTRVRSVR